MEASASPDWLAAHQQEQSKAKAGNPNWRRGMKSPNPNGRPRGIVDKRQRINQSMLDQLHDVVKVVTDNALAGDTSAAALLLARCLPALRSQTERVQFEFDANAPLTEQVQSVLKAIANGEVSSDVGKQIVDVIASLGSIKQIDELEERLARLEGKL